MPVKAAFEISKPMPASQPVQVEQDLLGAAKTKKAGLDHAPELSEPLNQNLPAAGLVRSLQPCLGQSQPELSC